MSESRRTPRLVAVSDRAAGQTFDLSADEIVIGRDAGNQVAINDTALSRRHCALVRTPEGWTIRDRGSVNGVVVNGQKVIEQLLKDGDHILIGKTELLFRVDAEPAPTPSSQ